MKKIIVVLVVVGFIALYLVRRASEKYQEVEGNLYEFKSANSAERLGFVAPGAATGQAPGTPPPPPAAPGSPPSAPSTPTSPPAASSESGVVPTGQADVVISSREIAAFDPAHPTNQIGKFLKNTTLTIGPKDALSGMYFVTFRPPGGKPRRVLCRGEDLGRE
jgi:hypothetical protein